MVRTRYAPSPTGYLHIGNLRTALYEYLIARHNNGKFVLRIEDTDQERFVDGATEFVYEALRIAGIAHDEGPDIGGPYGPYIQSLRKDTYLPYARELVENGKAYYCFCTKERLEALRLTSEKDMVKYDRHCLHLPKDTIEQNLNDKLPFVVRQRIPDGQTTFDDQVYGAITVNNEELDDQILIKSDGMPTYNFANVIDDHLMEITHVVRGCEYLSSAPKYNLLYEAFGWDIPEYIHLPLIVNQNGVKLSKRRGDASFEDLLAAGYLPEAIINYVALLGWSPAGNTEIFSMEELIQAFDVSRISKSPSIFDTAKLTWMNGCYIQKMPPEAFYELVLPSLQRAIRRVDIDLKQIAQMVQPRVSFAKDAVALLGFVDELPEYDASLYVHKKMKTTIDNSLDSLERAMPLLQGIEVWAEDTLHSSLLGLAQEMGIKNGQMLWPVRTALSGQPTSPCGATELAALLGKTECICRIQKGIDKLKTASSK